ncbi:MAG: Acetyltransferase domain [Pseudomonadota bacterium]|jgi:RimJ/RimL family protein N-acetyltransferase
MFNSRSMHCPLRTARFTLRPVGFADGPQLLPLLAGSSAVELDGAPLHHLHQAEQAASLLAVDPATARAWIVCSGVVPIGLVSVHDVVDATGEIAFFISAAHRRQRCATEAVTAVIAFNRAVWRLHRLVAHTASHNLPARQLLSQLGFLADEGAHEDMHEDDKGTCRFTRLLASPSSQGGRRCRSVSTNRSGDRTC